MLKNSKLEKYDVFMVDEEQKYVKSETILAYTKADAIIIFVDKYYKLVNTTKCWRIGAYRHFD